MAWYWRVCSVMTSGLDGAHAFFEHGTKGWDQVGAWDLCFGAIGHAAYLGDTLGGVKTGRFRPGPTHALKATKAPREWTNAQPLAR